MAAWEKFTSESRFGYSHIPGPKVLTILRGVSALKRVVDPHLFPVPYKAECPQEAQSDDDTTRSRNIHRIAIDSIQRGRHQTTGDTFTTVIKEDTGNLRQKQQQRDGFKEEMECIDMSSC